MGAPSCGFIGIGSNKFERGTRMESDLKNEFVDSGRASNSRWCQRNSFTSAPNGEREKSNGFVNVTGASLTGASRLTAATARPGGSNEARSLKSRMLNGLSPRRPKLSGNTPCPGEMSGGTTIVYVCHSGASSWTRAARNVRRATPVEAAASDAGPGIVWVNAPFWKILVTRGKRKFCASRISPDSAAAWQAREVSRTRPLTTA